MNNDIHSETLDSKIALVAGNGSFPVQFVKNAKLRGIEVVVIALKDEALGELKTLASSWYQLKVGEFGKFLKILKKEEIKQVAFAGGVKRIKLFGNLRIDIKGLCLLAKAKTIRDDVLFRFISNELKEYGVKVISPTVLLSESVAKEGLLTKRDFSPQELSDVNFGWNVVKGIGSFDIGQSVVVADGLIVAVEAVEGTDMMILRAGELIQKSAKSKKGVIVKLVKPQQDLRIDLPTVGPKTIENMITAKLTALAIEADKTVIIDPVVFQKLANENNMAVRAFKKEEV